VVTKETGRGTEEIQINCKMYGEEGGSG